jgi:ABC-type branched-subunit amino acid transport system substrate-binding protein
VNRLSGTRGSASVPTLIAVFVAGSLIGALAAVEVVPADKLPLAAQQAETPGGTGPTGATGAGKGGNVSGQPTGATGATGVKGGGGGSGRSGNGGSGTVALPPSKFECRPGANGGATERGVTATSINLATTIVGTGRGSAFLGEMQYAIEAVRDQVNNSGGICGRKLVIETRDDGWDGPKGEQYLQNYINDKNKFGIPVGASSEGLEGVIANHDITNAGFPVIGTDGLAIEQYIDAQSGIAQPWVWPVATATVSSARIMAGDAIKRGAQNLGIVYDKNYHFGKEAAAAFKAEVKRLTGKSVGDSCGQGFCGLIAGQNSYSSDALSFKNSGKDFVALFLEPETALTWMQDPNTLPAKDVKFGYGAAQPLFTQQFGKQCGAKCDQMVVWSGFKPNVEKYRNDPAMLAYINALKSKNPSADPFNQFTESAYVGMQFLVKALRTVGPELTRARLKAVLDTMSYADPLTLQGTLTFTPTTRFANITMQAFTMNYKGSFAGWRLGVTARDPRPGR